jgi:uncharacterized protein
VIKMHPVIETMVKRSPHMSWLRRGTVLLVRHGSFAYGTNTETSDIDVKGIATPPLKYFLGTTHRFEQAELKNPEPDAVIYDIRKFFNLAMDCNPAIIEVLHTDPSDHLIVDPIGEVILDHRHQFLSKKAKMTFSGYAISQLKRLKLHRRWYLNPIDHNPTRSEFQLPENTLIPQDQLLAAEAEVRKEMERFSFDFMDGLEEPTKIEIRMAMETMLSELKITAEQHWLGAARKIGLDDNFIELMKRERQYTSARREYDQYQNWKQNRNKTRALMEEKFGYDGKFALHLCRLLKMGKEILSTGKVIVKRPDREELLSIRNGAWSFEQLIDFAENAEKELNTLYDTCHILPKAPDKEKLDNLCIELVERSLSKWSGYSIGKWWQGYCR